MTQNQKCKLDIMMFQTGGLILSHKYHFMKQNPSEETDKETETDSNRTYKTTFDPVCDYS